MPGSYIPVDVLIASLSSAYLYFDRSIFLVDFCPAGAPNAGALMRDERILLIEPYSMEISISQVFSSYYK